MKNLFRNNLRKILLIVAFGVISSLFLTSKAHAQNITGVEGLNRVGPRNPETGYPLWYEDKNKMKLQLCLDPDKCFLETPNPLLPLHMPTNFPDESFFYAAESIFSSPHPELKGVRAVLVMALEGMFFSDAGVIVDDQAVMSRIRIRIDGLRKGQEYSVIYPYGLETFLVEGDAGPGAAKGPGISMTRDIGLVEPLFFEGPLKGDIGPFLVEAGYAGEPFISDGGLTEVEVTGSPLNTNVFRIEGPGVGSTYVDFDPLGGLRPNECADLTPIGHLKDIVPKLAKEDCAESKYFSVMGQIATKFGATIDRATYTKEPTGIFVNVWANTVEQKELVASIDGGPAMNLTEGLAGNYFGRFKVTSGQIPKSVTVTNKTDIPATSETRAIFVELSIKEATYLVDDALYLAVQSGNLEDPITVNASLITGQAPPVIFPLKDKTGGLAAGKKFIPTLVDGISGEQPPLKIIFTSIDKLTGKVLGSVEGVVTVLGAPTAGGLMDGVLAITGPDQNIIANGTNVVILNGSASLGPISLEYAWTQNPPGTVTLKDNSTDLAPNSESAVVKFVTPVDLSTQDPPGRLSVEFTLTVTDPILGTTSSNVVTVNMVQPATLAVDTCKFAADPPPGVQLHLPGAPRYRENRKKWIVEGTCELPNNQIVSVYLGDDTGPNLTKLIGTTRVDAVGNWVVAPGNRSAGPDGTIPGFDPTQPDPKTPIPLNAKVWVISERGGTASSTFTIN